MSVCDICGGNGHKVTGDGDEKSKSLRCIAINLATIANNTYDTR